MSDENKELAPIDQRDNRDIALELSAALASAVPWVGGALGNYLLGKVSDRKFRRVAEELNALMSDLSRVESAAAKEYVRTEEFEDLLDATMQKIANERDAEKRRLFRAFLVNTVASPGESWNEKQRFLRTIDDLEPDHIRLLGALLQPPANDVGSGYGSIHSTLTKRVPTVGFRLGELIRDLDRWGLAHVGETGGMMTAHGAEDLRSRVTPYGQRFMSYVAARD